LMTLTVVKQLLETRRWEYDESHPQRGRGGKQALYQIHLS